MVIRTEPIPSGIEASPPYPVASLKPPLDATQRTNIYNYLNVHGYYSPDISKVSDANLIKAYGRVVKAAAKIPGGSNIGGPVVNQDPVTSALLGIGESGAKVATSVLSWSELLAKFLGNLMSAAFWIRAAEVVGGLILITVGLNHLAIKAIQPAMSNPIVKQALKAA